MSNSDPILPRHVTLLGEALQPLLAQVETQLRASVGADGAEVLFKEVVSEALDDLPVFVERLRSEASGVLNEVVGADAPADAEVYRAVARFEMVFDDFLGSYSELRDLRDWMKQQAKAEKKVAERRKERRLEMERLNEEARIEEARLEARLAEERFVCTALAVATGVFLGGLFFGDD